MKILNKYYYLSTLQQPPPSSVDVHIFPQLFIPLKHANN
jgi:hypothetical protein